MMKLDNLVIRYVKPFEIHDLSSQIEKMIKEHPDWTSKDIVKWLASEC
jgi:hypothetical protein